MTRSAYSQSKVLWHLDRLDDLRRHGHALPIHVQLVLSDLCNQDCSFCAYRMSSGLSSANFGTAETHNPARRIPTAKALEVIEDCAALGARAIQFTGGGEPTVHPDHLQIFEAAQRAGMSTGLVTNGVRLRAARANLEHAWIRVSVDAGTDATYARIRRVPRSSWARVWRNVELLAPEYAGVLGIGFVVTPENYREIARAAARAREAGASSLRIGAVFSEQGLGFYGPLVPAIREAIGEALDEQRDGFEVVDLFDRRLEDLAAGSPAQAFCGYQYVTIYIGGDLKVYRCCNTAYTDAGELGSIADRRLAELIVKFPQDGFDARACRYCQFRGHNDAIAAVLKRPFHADFV